MKNVNHIPLRISLLLGFLTLCLTATYGATIVSLTQSEIQCATAGNSYAERSVVSASGTWTGRMQINTSTGYVQISKSANNNYLCSPTFPGGVTQVMIRTCNSTSSGRTFYLRKDANTAQPTSGDYGSGTIPKADGTVTITVTGSPSQFYIYSNGVAYISSVTVTYTPGTPLTAPTSLSAGTPTATTVPLSWVAGDAENTQNYKIEYKKSTEDNWTEYTVEYPTGTSCTLTGLTPSTTYNWRVTAIPTDAAKAANKKKSNPAVAQETFTTTNNSNPVDPTTNQATFTIQSASSATLTTGKAPTGSAVTFSNTYSTPTQIAADHTATITLSGYTGKVITGVSVYTKSDSDAGTGTYEVKVGNQIVYTATGTYKELFGNWSTSFELQSLPITNAYVQSGEEITIKISATANSLYCQSFTVQYGDPDYTRVISDNYGTICLDHGVDAGNLFGGTFYEGDYLLMNGTSPYKYYLTEVDHLEAGYPYVYVANPNASQLAVVYNNETNTAQSKRGLNGTLTDIATWESDGTNALTGNYMIVNNLFCQCGTWCGLYANRAYLDINAVDLPREYTEQPAQTGKRRLVLTNQDAPTPTGWNYLSEEGETKLSEPQKFIINNRLVIIRGNKTYDATGARLK